MEKRVYKVKVRYYLTDLKKLRSKEKEETLVVTATSKAESIWLAKCEIYRKVRAKYTDMFIPIFIRVQPEKGGINA